MGISLAIRNVPEDRFAMPILFPPAATAVVASWLKRLATFQDSFVNRVSANPEPVINFISQQGERTVIFRGSGRPKGPDYFELQRGMARVVFPEMVLLARGQFDFRRQIAIRPPEFRSGQ